MNFNSFSRLLEQFFLTVGQNNFVNKIPLFQLKHTDGSGNLPEMKCEECDKTFPSLRQLKKHRHGVHSEKQECKICGKIFNKSGYRAHIKVAHVNKDFKEFKCDLCDFSSHAWKYVKTHKLNCHETESHTLSCEKCGRRFAFPSQLKKVCSHFFTYYRNFLIRQCLGFDKNFVFTRVQNM